MLHSQYAYLITILIFGGTALLVELLLQRKRIVWYRRTLLIVAIVSVVTAVTEAPALIMHAWANNPERTLPIHILGAQFETFIFGLVCGLCVGIATLVLADYQDKQLPLLRTMLRLKPKRQKADKA